MGRLREIMADPGQQRGGAKNRLAEQMESGVLSLERCDQPAGTKKTQVIHRRKFRPKATNEKKDPSMDNEKPEGFWGIKSAAAHL